MNVAWQSEMEPVARCRTTTLRIATTYTHDCANSVVNWSVAQKGTLTARRIETAAVTASRLRSDEIRIVGRRPASPRSAGPAAGPLDGTVSVAVPEPTDSSAESVVSAAPDGTSPASALVAISPPVRRRVAIQLAGYRNTFRYGAVICASSLVQV